MNKSLEKVKRIYQEIFSDDIIDFNKLDGNTGNTALEEIKKRNYNKEIGGYLPDKNANITNISPFIKKILTEFDDVVVFAFDALSFNYFKNEIAKFLPVERGGFGIITSVFPSTTGTAWHSIITGTSPSKSASYGTSFTHEQFKKNYIWISNTINHKGLREEVLESSKMKINLSGKQTLFQFAKKKGFDSFYTGTHGTSTYNPFRNELTKGALHVEPIIPGYAALKRKPAKLLSYFLKQNEAILTQKKQKKIIWNYIDLDDYIHEMGYEKLGKEIEWKRVFLFWKRWSAINRIFLFISDHGQTPQAKRDIAILKLSAENNDLKYNTGGAGRVLFFYPKKGKTQKVKKWIKKIIGNTGIILNKKDLIRLKLFDKNPKAYERVGDIIVLATKASFPSIGCRDYINEHGSLSEEEMFIPIAFFS